MVVARWRVVCLAAVSFTVVRDEAWAEVKLVGLGNDGASRGSWLFVMVVVLAMVALQASQG